MKALKANKEVTKSWCQSPIPWYKQICSWLEGLQPLWCITQVSQLQHWWYNPVTAIVKLWGSAGCLSIAITCTSCFAVQDETNAFKNTPNVQNLNIKKSLLCWEWHVSKKLQGWVCNYHLFNWPTQFQANTVLNHLSQISWEGKNTFYLYSYIHPSSYLSLPSHQPCLSNWVSAGVIYSITEYMNSFRMSVFVTNHGPSSFIQLANARRMPGWHVNCDQETAAEFRKSYEVNKELKDQFISSWCSDAYASHQWRNKFLKGSLSGYCHRKPSFLRCYGSLMAY